ncbi:hypothetical protein ASC95_13595 [Pelomonas sp. Root1217]|uniref:hypothetical protein n=1 Tax=Pelomonas sp. Root1217 TaxID=1736430 RepID=UPI00070D647C|nr:hypothetical protein [Pelomonas sp. Root1217]KQV50405.1 hypothetical protein ASC95_13595 [Pelomonas sp. Root1217]
MRRGLTTILLMLCMCWQALAHAGIAVGMAGQEEQQHALMHFEGQAHHHDDHGDASGVHEDQSLASAHHLASDCGLHSPVLMTRVDLHLPQLPPAMPVQTAATPLRPPCLAGPERPPKAQS